MHVPTIIQELLDLLGEPQWKLGKRLGVSQGTVSKWLRGEQDPTKSQWDKVSELYAKTKGWKISLDDKISHVDAETQQRIHEIVDRILEIQKQTGRREK